MDIFPISYTQRTLYPSFALANIIAISMIMKYSGNVFFLQYHRGHLSQNTTLTRRPLIWFLLSPETKANLKTWLLPKIGISSLRFSSYFFYGRTREEVFPVISFQVRFSEVSNFNILENAIKEDYYLKKILYLLCGIPFEKTWQKRL